MSSDCRRYAGARERQYAMPSQHGRQYIIPAASNCQNAVLGNQYGSGVRRSMLCPSSASSEKHYESLLDKQHVSAAANKTDKYSAFSTSGGKQYMTAAVMEKQYLAAAVLDWSLRYPPRSPPTSEETFTGTENRHVQCFLLKYAQYFISTHGLWPLVTSSPSFLLRSLYNWKYMYLVNFLLVFVKNPTIELEEKHNLNPTVSFPLSRI